MTGRELKARYRGSVLGFCWSLVNPLLLLMVYTFVFSYVFEPRDPEVSPYGLFLISGLFPWIWFQTSVMEGTVTMSANAGLIRKATFPAEILPVVSVLSNLVHFAFALPMIGVAVVFFRWLGHDVGGWAVVFLPLIILVQLPMVAGLTLGLAAMNAHFKDIKDILANLLTLLFFMTPILYSLKMLDQHPSIQKVVSYNPLVFFTRAYQQSLFYDQTPEMGLWLGMLVTSAICWGAGTWLFARLSETMVEAV